MKYFYDTEFIEDRTTIDLISIGIVAEDGREYYAACRDAPWKRIFKHDWLMANVVPHLPRYHGDARMHYTSKRNPMALDFARMKDRSTIGGEVVDFLNEPAEDVELWAYYGAYDHVVLAWLWGPMSDLPSGVPMWTHELMQLWETAGRPDKPEQPTNAHDAIADARWNRDMHRVCVDALALLGGS